VQEDIAGGVAAVRRVSAMDAIGVEEVKDSGPAYFILTREGRTLYVGFQELDRYKSRGFPWTEFEFVEAPHSGTFFSIKKVGEKLKPSQVRPFLGWDEMKGIRGFDINKRYQLLDLDFAQLKHEASGRRRP
jgi:hypothetical protein